jgi:GNAT superfamily N-acetyltransferase
VQCKDHAVPRSLVLEEAVDAAWAEALGCETELLHEPGAHLVAGGEALKGRAAVLAAQVGVGTLVYCPDALRDRARRILAETEPRTAFSAVVCARIAGVVESEVLGPSWHGFVDRARFVSGTAREGGRVERDDPLFNALRIACGDDAWAEGGFFHDPMAFDGVLYGIEEDGRLVAAGNMTPYRGLPADVGLVTHPDARGRGLAKRLAAKMVSDALPHVEVVRYRALLTNAASLGVARSLGFDERGRNYIVRSPS